MFKYGRRGSEETGGNQKNGKRQQRVKYFLFHPPEWHTLFALGCGVALVRPVCPDAGSQIQHTHFSEALFRQLLVCRTNVGTVIPWTTAAVDNNEAIVRQRFGARAQFLHSFSSAHWPHVLGSRNVRLCIDQPRAHV